MNVQTTEAQVWWIALADEIRPREAVPLRIWMEAIQNKFSFAQVPTQLPAAGQGFDFRAGTLEAGESSIAVALVSVYTDGISVHVQSHTRNAETVLQEVLAIFFRLGMREPTTPPLHYYVSTIVADFDRSLDGLLAPPLLQIISAAMPVQGDAQLFHFHVNFDQSKIPGRIGPINPTNFRVERRNGIPYDQNRYFCQANTTTEKHIELLERMEQLA
jgi:hypothetical protein